MKVFGVLFLAFLVLLYGMPLSVSAQESSTVFAVPHGIVGEAYRANIATVLRENYQLRLETDSRASIFRWSVAQGEVPPGLIVRANGTIAGTPRVARAEPYRFQLKVVDLATSHGAALTLEFSLAVSSAGIRLAHIRPPMLVPTQSRTPEVTAKSIAGSSANNISPRANGLRSSADPAIPSRRQTWTADSVYASMLRANNDSASTVETNSTPFAPVTAATTVSCTLQCDPTPTPDPKNDFIIDAVTGATSGKTKFNRGDRARIIIRNKNPFLYEYRVTIEESVVEEPGLAGFLELLPVGKGTFGEAKASDKAAAQDARQAQNLLIANNAAIACPFLDALLDAEKVLDTSENELTEALDGLTDKYNDAQEQSKPLKTALTSPGAQCPSLCSDANTLLSTLRSYLNGSKTAFEQFTKAVSKFEERANAFNTNVSDLKETNTACASEIDKAHLVRLAEHYVEVAEKLNEGLAKLKTGREGFDTSAKSIEKVFATANAFYEVREVGDFDLPTNVKIKLERKEIAKDKAEFAKYVDTTLNFGGGQRFTLAGGLVASLLERPEYERVATVVNGQAVNIVGLKRTSSSRVLPLLMLHSRIYDTRRSFIDGIHFSVGITAKPNSEGTSAEFLFGPSISFIEGRMFFTAGGYMGKKQELQGDFVLGSQIPQAFGSDLPTSEHYVWKPGFAVTYKIK